MKSKKCKFKGCMNSVWSGGFCQNHITKKPLSNKSSYRWPHKNSSGMKKTNKAILAQIRHEFFVEIWNKRPHESEVSGEKLFGEPLSTFFHHILPKSKYPTAALDEENIIILTPDEHATVESKMYFYEEVNKRRDYLMEKYNL